MPQAERPFGSGEMIAELNRFNWGAFLLPVVWALAYGSWQVLGAWLVAVSSPVLITMLAGADQLSASVSALVAATVASEVVSGLARLWAGANANRFLWSRERLRQEVIVGSGPRFTVETFVHKQRRWTIWGGIAVGVMAVATIPVASVVWSEYELTYVGAIVPIVWLVAEVVLGVWLDRKMQMEASAAPR